MKTTGLEGKKVFLGFFSIEVGVLARLADIDPTGIGVGMDVEVGSSRAGEGQGIN